MTYELAKELKEAGFPQDLDRKPVWVKDGEILLTLPTLEELIEACGENFEEVQRTADGTFRFGQRMPDGELAISFSTYHTPSEAVAKLYLALNKDKQL